MIDETHGSGHRWFIGPYSRLGLSVAALTCLVDQAHKWWILLGYGLREKGTVAVAPFLDLVFRLNRGVSFSFFTGSGRQWQWALAAFAAVAAVALTIWLARGIQNRLAAVSVGLIMGGALGNGLDRLTLGGVADYFALHAFGYNWPTIFNIADVAIVVGVAGLLFEQMAMTQPRADAGGATKPPQS